MKIRPHGCFRMELLQLIKLSKKKSLRPFAFVLFAISQKKPKLFQKHNQPGMHSPA